MVKHPDPDTNNEAGSLQKLAELIADVRVAMLTTFPADHATNAPPAHVRPMYTQKVEPNEFDGTLWFMTDAESGKVDELAENSQVVVTYSAPDKNRYVVVYGTAGPNGIRTRPASCGMSTPKVGTPTAPRIAHRCSLKCESIRRSTGTARRTLPIC